MGSKMGTAFSYNDDFHLRLIKNVEKNLVNNVDEILFCIKEFRLEIALKIEQLEQKIETEPNLERNIAVLIRQDQYLEALEQKPKYKLHDLFFEDSKQDPNNGVLKWYKRD